VAGCVAWWCGRVVRRFALPARARTPAAAATLAVLTIVMLVTLQRSVPAASRKPVPPGVVLITVDALRCDYLSCYGGPVQTRNIDRLAQEGVRFEDAISVCPWTRPSCATMHLGVYPTVHGIGETGVVKYDATANVFPARLTTLAEALHAGGFATQAFVNSPQLHPGFGFGRGFDRYDTYQEASREWPWIHLDEAAQPGRLVTRHSRYLSNFHFVSRDHHPDRYAHVGARFCRLAVADTFMTAAALRWLRRQEEPFLLWLHYMSVHQYGHFRLQSSTPDPGRGPVRLIDVATTTTTDGPVWFYLIRTPGAEDEECSATGEEDKTPIHWPAPESLEDPVANGLDLSFYMNRYKANLAHLDSVIGCLLSELKALGLWDTTHIVFTSDHGEEFGDHGGAWHGRTHYEEVVRVPLIIKSPALSQKGVGLEGSASLTDLAPTVLELAGLPVPTTFAGASLLPMARGEDTEARAVHSEFLEDREGERKALRWRTMKCISAGGEKEPELYDLAKDPREQHNLAEDRPERLQEMLDLLARWQKEQKLISAEVRKERQGRVAVDEDTIEMLKTLGYVE